MANDRDHGFPRGDCHGERGTSCWWQLERGTPPTATDLDDDKEGILQMVSIGDSDGSDLDSGSNVGTRIGLSGDVESLRNKTRRLSIAGTWKVW